MGNAQVGKLRVLQVWPVQQEREPLPHQPPLCWCPRSPACWSGHATCCQLLLIRAAAPTLRLSSPRPTQRVCALSSSRPLPWQPHAACEWACSPQCWAFPTISPTSPHTHHFPIHQGSQLFAGGSLAGPSPQVRGPTKLGALSMWGGEWG